MNTPAKHTTHGTSSVRLAVAIRSMQSAETMTAVIAAKDKAKAGGLTDKDTERLRTAFSTAKARINRQLHAEQQASTPTFPSTVT